MRRNDIIPVILMAIGMLSLVPYMFAPVSRTEMSLVLTEDDNKVYMRIFLERGETIVIENNSLLVYINGSPVAQYSAKKAVLIEIEFVAPHPPVSANVALVRIRGENVYMFLMAFLPFGLAGAILGCPPKRTITALTWWEKITVIGVYAGVLVIFIFPATGNIICASVLVLMFAISTPVLVGFYPRNRNMAINVALLAYSIILIVYPVVGMTMEHKAIELAYDKRSLEAIFYVGILLALTPVCILMETMLIVVVYLQKIREFKATIPTDEKLERELHLIIKKGGPEEFLTAVRSMSETTARVIRAALELYARDGITSFTLHSLITSTPYLSKKDYERVSWDIIKKTGLFMLREGRIKAFFLRENDPLIRKFLSRVKKTMVQ